MASAPNLTLTIRAAWLAGGKTIGFALAFALPLLLVRRLSQSEFGLYKQVFLFVSSAMAFLPVGFQMSAYYFFARESKEQQGQVVFNILVFLMVVTSAACLVVILFPSFLLKLFGNPEMMKQAPLVGFIVMTWVVSSFLDHVILARQETKLATLLLVISQVTKTSLLLGAVIIFSSVRALLFAAIIQGFLQTTILIVYLRFRFGRFWKDFNWLLMRQQLAYALPLGIASILLQLQTTLDNYFVSNLFGAEAFAVYSIGCFQLPLVIILTESIGLTTLPRVNELQNAGKTREVVELLSRVIRKQSLVYLPLYVVLLVIGRELIELLFTRQYLGSWPIFAVNLILIPLAIISSASDPVIRAYSAHRYFVLRTRTVLVVLLVLGLWLFAPRFGMIGAITVMASVSVLESAIIAAKIVTILGVRASDLRLLKDVAKIGAAACSAGAVTWVVRVAMADMFPFAILIVCGAVFLLVYLALILIAGVLTAEELRSVRHSFARLHQQIFSRPAPTTRNGS
jgi:O-antigen/teichoic acid export membrane protein